MKKSKEWWGGDQIIIRKYWKLAKTLKVKPNKKKIKKFSTILEKKLTCSLTRDKHFLV